MAANDPVPVAIHADPQTGAVVATTEDGELAPPDHDTNDFIWRSIVITGCVLVLIGGIGLVVGMYLPSNGRVSPDEVTNIFLVVFGFLAGLVAQRAGSSTRG